MIAQAFFMFYHGGLVTCAMATFSFSQEEVVSNILECIHPRLTGKYRLEQLRICNNRVIEIAKVAISLEIHTIITGATKQWVLYFVPISCRL